MAKNVISIAQNSTGRNISFKDVSSGIKMTRSQFVSKIESNIYPDYHERIINKIKTPCSNPDKSERNNLA